MHTTLLLGCLSLTFCLFLAVGFSQDSRASSEDMTHDFFKPRRDVEDDHLVTFRDSSSDTLARAVMRIFHGKACDRDYVLCNTHCSHSKLVSRRDGCCLCACRRGYALSANRKSCLPASWTSWSTWSTCITSSWGGLQTRERLCMSGGVVKMGRCVGAGSESRTCNSVTAPYRIRKNVRYLTDEEKHDFIQAYTKFKADKTSDGFMYIVKWHGWPYECPWYKHIKGHSNGHCSWHGHPLFLAWHRMIIIQLEMGMNKYLKNKTLGMPYWDWTEKGWTKLPLLVRNPSIYDPILKKKVKNPWYSTALPTHKPTFLNQTVRSLRIPQYKGLSMHLLLLRSVIRSMSMADYQQFDGMLVQPHNQIHNCLCVSSNPVINELCEYSMLTVSYSAFDPIFGLHHSQIDRLYSLYTAVHQEAGDVDWTKSSFVGSYLKARVHMRASYTYSFDWPLSPFCNSTMNPNPVTLTDKVWTVRNSFYYQQLFGYKYDTLNVAGRDWKYLAQDVKVNQESLHYGKMVPFVSHMDPSLGLITDSNTKYQDGCTLPKHSRRRSSGKTAK